MAFQMVYVYGYNDENKMTNLGKFTTAVLMEDKVVVFPGKRTLLSREVLPANSQRGERVVWRQHGIDSREVIPANSQRGERVVWRQHGIDSKPVAVRFAWFEVTTVEA